MSHRRPLKRDGEPKSHIKFREDLKNPDYRFGIGPKKAKYDDLTRNQKKRIALARARANQKIAQKQIKILCEKFFPENGTRLWNLILPILADEADLSKEEKLREDQLKILCDKFFPDNNTVLVFPEAK